MSQADIEYLIELVVQEVDDYGNTFEFYRFQLNSTQLNRELRTQVPDTSKSAS